MDPKALRLDPQDTVVAVIDVQEKLVAAMPEEARTRTVRNVANLVEGARVLGVPVIVTEQYPKGLGPTVGPVREAVARIAGAGAPIEKVEFDACAVPAFAEALEKLGRHTVVLAGMEAHICVYQTARALAARGLTVHVPMDAVCSRVPENLAVAEKLYERTGAVTTSTETVLFDLLGRASGDAFKTISKLVK